MSDKSNLPTIVDNNANLSEMFHRSQYQNIKRHEKANNVKMQSEPKTSKKQSQKNGPLSNKGLRTLDMTSMSQLSPTSLK